MEKQDSLSESDNSKNFTEKTNTFTSTLKSNAKDDKYKGAIPLGKVSTTEDGIRHQVMMMNKDRLKKIQEENENVKIYEYEYEKEYTPLPMTIIKPLFLSTRTLFIKITQEHPEWQEPIQLLKEGETILFKYYTSKLSKYTTEKCKNLGYETISKGIELLIKHHSEWKEAIHCMKQLPSIEEFGQNHCSILKDQIPFLEDLLDDKIRFKIIEKDPEINKLFPLHSRIFQHLASYKTTPERERMIWYLIYTRECQEQGKIDATTADINASTTIQQQLIEKPILKKQATQEKMKTKNENKSNKKYLSGSEKRKLKRMMKGEKNNINESKNDDKVIECENVELK